MALRMNGWTPTQARLWELLKGGVRRTKAELKQALPQPDDEDSDTQLRQHLVDMRRRTKQRGYDIVCVFRQRRTNYQLFKMVSDE